MKLTTLKHEFTQCFAIIKDVTFGNIVIPTSRKSELRALEIMKELEHHVEHSNLREEEKQEIRIIVGFFSQHLNDPIVAPGQVEEDLKQVALRSIRKVDERQLELLDESTQNTPVITVAETTLI